MPITRVQASPSATATGTTTVAITFTTPPAVGHGLIVMVNTYLAAAITCSDTQGNAYTAGPGAVQALTRARIFYCPLVATTGAPFTITVSTAGGAADWHALAVEVGGLGVNGLVFEGSASGGGTGNNADTGAVSPLERAESFQAATLAISGAQASLVVDSATPAWTVEFEALAVAPVAGEGVTRSVSSATGTSPTVGWTLDTLFADWVAVLGAFTSDVIDEAAAAAAIDLGLLPASLTVDVNDAGVTTTVCYKYTAQVGDQVIGLFAYGDATYQVRTRVYTGAPGAFTAWLTFNTVSALNDALQIPVEAGHVYYFEFSSWDGNVTPAILTLRVEAAPTATATVGDIGINAETDGYPMVVLDPTTAAVQRFVYPFPNGEYGASLPDGHLCVEDKYDDTVSVYTGGGAGSLVATVSLGSASSSQPSVVVGSNRTDRFYLGRTLASVSSEIYTLSLTGTLSGVLWTLPVNPLQALAVNLTDTILYYAAYADGSPIYAYDLVGDAPLANLAAGVSGYLVMPDLFVLADGSILAAYVRLVATNPSCVVKRYSAAGATLNTYPFDFASTSTVRLACAREDPNSFWLKRHRTGGQVTYYHLRVSDGAELSSATGAEFDHGVSSYNFPLDDAAHYGNAASCPFWIIEHTDGNGGGNGGNGGGGGGGGEPTMCLTGPPQAACWAPHDLAVLQIGLIAEDEQP